MPKLRQLSGKDIVKIFSQFGFEVTSQKGSHIKLQRITKESNQILTIPFHKDLDRGTVKAIYRQSLKYIPEEKLKEHFYTA